MPVNSTAIATSSESYASLTTAIIYTFYTTYCPKKTTFTVGTNTIVTQGSVTLNNHGLFTLTETWEPSVVAKQSSLLSKALAAASSVSAASLLSAGYGNSSKPSFSLTDSEALSVSESGSSSDSESDNTLSQYSSSKSANGAAQNYLAGGSLAGALAVAACLL